jgi:hypothetical protein
MRRIVGWLLGVHFKMYLKRLERKKREQFAMIMAQSNAIMSQKGGYKRD